MQLSEVYRGSFLVSEVWRSDKGLHFKVTKNGRSIMHGREKTDKSELELAQEKMALVKSLIREES